MKKLLCVILSGALILTLTACGQKGPKPFDPAADAKALMETSGVFVQPLEEIDRSTACALYGMDEAAVKSSAVYMANATSAEELAIFTFASETDAQAAAKLLGYRVEDRIDGLRDYLPNEIPKLESAVIEVRGASILLLIASDYTAAEKVLNGK